MQPCEERGPCLICPSASCASLPLKPTVGLRTGIYLIMLRGRRRESACPVWAEVNGALLKPEGDSRSKPE